MKRGRSQAAPAKEAEFFKLNAHYCISEGARFEDLCDDMYCLLKSGIGVFEERFGAFDSAEWAGLYMLLQAMAVWKEVHIRVRALPGFSANEGGRHG